MTVARILLLGAVVLALGIDMVAGACNQRMVQRQIRQLEGDLRQAASEYAQAKSAFHAGLVALRGQQGSDPALDAAEVSQLALATPRW